MTVELPSVYFNFRSKIHLDHPVLPCRRPPSGRGSRPRRRGGTPTRPEPRTSSRSRSGGNYIKIGLPGKWILRDHFEENRTSKRPFLFLRISFQGRSFFYTIGPWNPPTCEAILPSEFVFVELGALGKQGGPTDFTPVIEVQ